MYFQTQTLRLLLNLPAPKLFVPRDVEPKILRRDAGFHLLQRMREILVSDWSDGVGRDVLDDAEGQASDWPVRCLTAQIGHVRTGVPGCAVRDLNHLREEENPSSAS